MTISRRSFFGIAAGAAAVAAGAAPAVADVAWTEQKFVAAGGIITGFDLAAGPDMAAVWLYGVEGMPFGGLISEIADKPVVHSPAVRAAIADQERRKRASRREFERLLSSPHGKGRLE